MRNRVKDLLDSIMYEHLLSVVKFYHNSCVLPCMVKVLDTLACISHFAKKIASYLYENLHPMTFCQIAFSLYISSKTCEIIWFRSYLFILFIFTNFDHRKRFCTHCCLTLGSRKFMGIFVQCQNTHFKIELAHTQITFPNIIHMTGSPRIISELINKHSEY